MKVLSNKEVTNYSILVLSIYTTKLNKKLDKGSQE